MKKLFIIAFFCITQIVCGQEGFTVWYKDSRFLMPKSNGNLSLVVGNDGFVIDRFLPVRDGFLFYSMEREKVYFCESKSGIIKDSISIFKKKFHTNAFMKFPIYKKKKIRHIKREILKFANNFYLINDTTIFLDYFLKKDSTYMGFCNIRNDSLFVNYNKAYVPLSSVHRDVNDNIISFVSGIAVRPDKNCALLRKEFASEDNNIRIFEYKLMFLDTTKKTRPEISFTDTIRKNIEIYAVPTFIVKDDDLILCPIDKSLILYKNYFNFEKEVQIYKSPLNIPGWYEYDIISKEEYIKRVYNNKKAEFFKLIRNGDSFHVDSIPAFKLSADQKIKNVIVRGGHVVFLLWNPFFNNYYLYKAKMNYGESLSVSFSDIFSKIDTAINVSKSQEEEPIITVLDKCEKISTFPKKRIEKELFQVIGKDFIPNRPIDLFKTICKVLADDPTKLLYLCAAEDDDISKFSAEQFFTSSNNTTDIEFITRLQNLSLKMVLNPSILDDIPNNCCHFSVFFDNWYFYFVKKRSIWHVLLKISRPI
ncbi:MAG: hypothetical protein GX259_03105 [Bacteroidales bacterium]|nr:hypothetical protein [Bacteroidales bacterium]